MSDVVNLSIVATLFRTAPHIEEFHRRVSNSARELVRDEYEIILVNDGSPDDSLDMAIEIAQRDPHLIVIDLSRNFGHHKAILTGLAHARGDRVFLIDSDLEEEPEWLTDFSHQMDRFNCDVVFGVQETRKGHVFERFSGWLFYKLFNAFSGLRLPENAVTARLMKRVYVDALLLHQECEVSIGGLFVITGFYQLPVSVRKHSTSKSTYSLSHKLAVMVDSITSFSSKPLIGIFYLGLVIFLIAGAAVTYLVIARIFFATPLTGWTSVMASIWLLGGMVVMFIGIVGIYLSKVFSEAKRRPNSIVKKVYSRDNL